LPKVLDVKVDVKEAVKEVVMVVVMVDATDVMIVVAVTIAALAETIMGKWIFHT
jgi:hypothetical protein